MPRSAPRIRVRRRTRPTVWRRLLQALWSCMRIVLVAGGALGPAPPPPPLPYRPTADMQASGTPAKGEDDS